MGGAAFGGSSAGGQMSSGLGVLGGYMAGSKMGQSSVYAPNTYTNRGETVTDITKNFNQQGLGNGLYQWPH